MFFRILIVATACCATLLAGCKKKMTAAELAEEERVKIREEKRVQAIQAYKDLAEKFPNHPKAKDAAAKAQALAAQAPPKKKECRENPPAPAPSAFGTLSIGSSRRIPMRTASWITPTRSSCWWPRSSARSARTSA